VGEDEGEAGVDVMGEQWEENGEAMKWIGSEVREIMERENR